MADINFYAGENFALTNLNGSGLGFYNNAFGTSISVGQWNKRTFITNANGTVQGPEVDNVQWYSTQSGILGGGATGSPVALTQIPNYLATLNVRFTNSSSVSVTNAKFYVYDRTSIANGPSGVTCRVAEIIHPDNTQINNGSGDTTWTTCSGTGSFISLVNSPGLSGLTPNGSGATTHDWYLAISCSPLTVGSKTQFGGYITLDYN